MLSRMRSLLLAVVGLAVMSGSACSTLIRPTKPDAPLTAMGPPLEGVRFDGEETVLREPGMPLSPSRAWSREVQNYTATSLNTLLSASDTAAAARTVVVFDMGSPSAIQVGTWKELSIGLTSTLPDGTVVRSKPVVGPIDDPFEYAAMTASTVGTTLLNVTGTASMILWLIMRNDTLGLVAIGSLIGGVVLSVAQSAGQYFIAASEEKRWSNLFARALTLHAEDVRRTLGTPRPAMGPAVGPAAPPPPSAAPDPSDVPPLLGAPAPAR